jgi:pimeloyl-ACP methyl ester carboxylesterase
LGRIVAYGHSAGGHLALWAAGRHKLPAASPLRAANPLKLRGVVAVGGLANIKQWERQIDAVCGDQSIALLTKARATGEAAAEKPTLEDRADQFADTNPASLLPTGTPLVLLHGKNGSPRSPLMRNFAERVAAAGTTVYLPAMPWSRAWNGTVADANAAIDALFAGFPAGTVSGAPKVRACQIIAELESEKRGAYAGGVGYFSPDGSMDSCIVLRTAVVKDGTMHVQAGAGIVADSDPAYEQRECEAKSGALLAAAREAIAQASAGGFGQ